MKGWFSHSFDNLVIASQYGVGFFKKQFSDFPKSDFKGISLTAPPTPDWWYRKVEAVKEEIQAGTYPKKILTHDISFVDDHPGEFIYTSEGDGRFLIELDHSRIVYGISPEKTIHKIYNDVTVEVLGGTSNKLLDSEGNILPKYLREHEIILDDLIERVPTIEVVESLSEKRLGYTNHLKSILKFKSNNESINNTIRKVYPNYAIYSDRINDWWGILVGTKTKEEYQLWLSIRCGLYFPKSGIHMIRSGVGITLDSDPDEEWNELYEKTGWLTVTK